MDVIHIIEKDLIIRNEPNFIRPGLDNVDPIKPKAIVGFLAVMPLISLPASLLVSAAISSPVIYKAISDSDSKKDQELDASEIKALESFLVNHGLTKAEAKERGYIFPPGHPTLGQSYRLHPLAEFSDSGKAGTYIPEDNYDDILLEERESELLKMLVSLGATRIEISQKLLKNEGSKFSARIEGGVDSVAKISASGEQNSAKEIENINSRIFELSGKPWNNSDKLNRNSFAWLSYEPSWDALIVARELGGCTSATIEIKENSRSSEDKRISMGLKAKIYSAQGGVSNGLLSEDNKIYLVKVSFSAVVK